MTVYCHFSSFCWQWTVLRQRASTRKGRESSRPPMINPTIWQFNLIKSHTYRHKSLLTKINNELRRILKIYLPICICIQDICELVPQITSSIQIKKRKRTWIGQIWIEKKTGKITIQAMYLNQKGKKKELIQETHKEDQWRMKRKHLLTLGTPWLSM